jgi:SAM-dependent methyltransferase
VQDAWPDGYARDNGFQTRVAMDEAHEPIVELARATIGDAGSVIDLGCGNAALLKKICESRPRVIPIGLDVEYQKLEHARQLLPDFAEHFVAGNMFESIPLDADTLYTLVVLMPGRLLEVDEPAAERLRGWLEGHFEHLLVYAYGEWLTRYDGLAGLAARAGFTLTSVHPSGAAGLAQIVNTRGSAV